jgi:hypothetical protein
MENLIGKKFKVNGSYGRFGADIITVIDQNDEKITVDSQIVESGNSTGLNRFMNAIKIGMAVAI